MATTQQYSLRWNNYFRHLTYSLDNHRNNDDFVDVSLCCDGRKIKAHKVVLSSCSGYFKEIFKENPHPHPVIIFKFIKYEDLNSIIEFMYQGEVNVQQEALQSFLQTAELLAVQGLTAEEKEKPKAPPTPIIDDHKFIKTIPSTIRAVNDASTGIAQHQQTSTQTIEIPTILTQHQQTPTVQQAHHVQTQIQHIQVQQSTQAPHQLQVHQQTQSPHQQQQQQQQQQLQHVTTATSTAVALQPTSNNLNSKKRKITFSDDDDNIYTTETVDYVKDEPSIEKSEISFLRGTVKMDIPEYIVGDVGDVDDSQPMSDGGTQQNSQDGTVTAQNVTQYTSEYEILTESEIEEKYQHGGDADNTEITMEMVLTPTGRLLNAPGDDSPTDNAQLDDASGADGGVGGGSTGSSLGVTKLDNKANTNDLPGNKWTECQFCKMVITTVNLWRHIRTQHTPQPPRKCEMCNKNFKNKYSLREHIRISHEQNRGKSEN